MMSGLNTFSSKLPDAPPMFTATSLPKTCAHAMVSASLCVGFTLPGMIELPGSFSGIVISPMPERGPEASQRTSFAIFMSDAASVLSAPCANTSASLAASASNLLGAVANGWPGQLGQPGRHPHRVLGVRVEASAHRGPAQRQLLQVRKGGLDVLQPVRELGGVARELLAQRERASRPAGGCVRSSRCRGRPSPWRRARRAAPSRWAGRARAGPPPRPRSWRWGRRRSDDCPWFTSSLGWTSRSSPRGPPRISLARFASTSFAFMLVWCRCRSARP